VVADAAVAEVATTVATAGQIQTRLKKKRAMAPATTVARWEHWARECQSKARKGEAHTDVDEESSLLPLEAGSVQIEIQISPSSSGGAGTSFGRFTVVGVCEEGCGLAEVDLQGFTNHGGFYPPGGR
jgi:hypothetical protein